MIDLHNHILPAIDDGSRNIDETIKLLEEAKIAGFDKIIFTPHYKEGVYEAENKEKIKLFLEVCQIAEKEIPEIELFLGNEIMATGSVFDYLKKYQAISLNNMNYVLFEIPMNSTPLVFNDIVFELKCQKLIPILAHPERYSYVHKNPEVIYDWIEMGVLMQQNFGSIIGQYGKKAQIIAQQMLKTNSVHFFGSDVHRPNTVYKNMPRIMNELKQIIGQEGVEELTVTNPNCVLQNKKINIKQQEKIKLNLFEKLRMKE